MIGSQGKSDGHGRPARWWQTVRLLLFVAWLLIGLLFLLLDPRSMCLGPPLFVRFFVFWMGAFLAFRLLEWLARFAAHRYAVALIALVLIAVCASILTGRPAVLFTGC
jgi:hypothetical protein